jgi:prevent-host-death family protein
VATEKLTATRLKNELAGTLERVEAGDWFTIMHHGRAVALVVPVEMGSWVREIDRRYHAKLPPFTPAALRRWIDSVEMEPLAVPTMLEDTADMP